MLNPGSEANGPNHAIHVTYMGQERGNLAAGQERMDPLTLVQHRLIMEGMAAVPLNGNAGIYEPMPRPRSNPNSHSSDSEKSDPQNAVKRLLLIDDHPIMRHGLAQLIRAEAGLEVCGESGTARDGLDAIGDLYPDLVVLDLTLPDKNGLELLKDIQAMHPGTLCLVLSMHDETLYGERALRAGARGYITKEAAADHLITAVRKVLSGGIYLSDSMASRMLEQMASGRPKASNLIDTLTDRELEVLEMIGQGIATKIIAERLCISTRTVEAHRSHIKEKLNITDGAALVRYAVEWIQKRQGV